MKRDIIVIGASAGGVEALRRVVRALPEGLPATILIVMHRVPYLPGLLAQILEQDGPLPVRNAVDGETPQNGRVYLAPPNRHLLLESGVLRVTRGPKENFSRPAIDPLFRSAAQEGEGRVVGVILSGTLFDGTAGLAAVKQQGGFAIVQNPQEAAFPEMPANAIAAVDVDRVLSLDEIAPFLVRLAKGLEEEIVGRPDALEGKGAAIPSEISEPSEIDRLPEVVQENRDEQIHGERHGQITVFTCPECSGPLWQAGTDTLVQFRCHVGHAYTGEGLAVHQNEILEQSLWFAVRTLADRSVLLRQLAENARKHGNLSSAQHFEREAQIAEGHAATLRQVIESCD